jgi:hypothetical protein
MSNEQDKTQSEITKERKDEEENVSNEEFKLTVKKLEMPVRPRGVLAE